MAVATGTALAIGSIAAAGASAGAGIYGASKQASSARSAADAQTSTANRAAELEAQSSAAALDFAKQQEDERKAEWQKTQDANYGIYQSEVARDNERYNARQQRLAPYQAYGAGAVTQMGQPIPGSIEALIQGGK